MRFSIDNFQVQDESYHVTGICCEGPIKIGSQFLKAYKNPTKRTEKGEYEFLGREDIKDTKLLVKEITAYRRSLEELPTGMTGEMILTGEQGICLDELYTLDTE
jgi:hypothetical protein